MKAVAQALERLETECSRAEAIPGSAMVRASDLRALIVAYRGGQAEIADLKQRGHLNYIHEYERAEPAERNLRDLRKAAHD